MDTMNSFADHMAAQRRLVMLRVLLSSTAYTTNSHALNSMTARLGYPVSMDRTRSDVAWLAEQGLVGVDDVAGLHIVRLTERGQDVGNGLACVPGVARPRAGEA